VALDQAQIDKILQNADLPAIVGSVTAIQQRGSEYLCKCTFHSPDNHPSMSIYHAGNGSGRWRYRCFSCGEDGDALDFMREYFGLEFKEAIEQLNGGKVWTPKVEPSPAQKSEPVKRVTGKPPEDAGVPNMEMRQLGKPARTWCYRDEDGAVLGYVARYEHDGRKEIRVFSWGSRGDDAPKWGCGHWTKPRPLYGLDELAIRKDATVLIVEGEKACDAARQLLPSYVAICWPGGAQAWKHTELEPLRARKVLLWPDADEPGVECMNALAGILGDPKGLACKVRIIDPFKPGENPEDEIPQGWDAADALAEGWTTEHLVEWAKPRASSFSLKIEPNAEPIPRDEPEPPPTPENPPEPEFPPEASEIRPQKAVKSAGAAKRRKPRLAAVRGNAVAAPDPDDEPMPASMSEDALAEHFTELHGRDWRYVKGWGTWFEWRADGWYKDETGLVDRLAVQVTRQALYWPEAMQLSPDGKRKVNSKRTAGNLRDIASNDRQIAATVDQWDTHPYLLGVPGGLVDLKVGKLLEARPELYITKRTSVAPEDGECPSWIALLSRVTAGDEAMMSYLQRWCGYVLTGETREECFAFVYGPAQTGKSTFIRALSEILGDYHRKASMDTFTESKHERHAEELAVLVGSRLVTAVETEEGKRWNESRIKALTGRDRIRARFMRENSFEFDPQFKLIIAGNHAPHLRNVDEAMRRRLHIIPFTQPVPMEERDDQLADKLRAEYPQILMWMIRGTLEWIDAKLGRPEQIAQAVDNYLESEDTLGSWLAEEVELGPNCKCLSGGAYAAFKRWAESAGEYSMSQKRFVQALKERGFDPKRYSGKRYIFGLELKSTEPTQSWADPDSGYEVP